MSEQCQVEDFIFVLPYGSKIIEVYYKKVSGQTSDRYMGKSSKDAKTAFENIKKFQPIPLPSGLKTYCDCTNKPCDPNSWFCHRNFPAIRYLKDKRFSGNNEKCVSMKTYDIQFISQEKVKNNV